jgi:hypothetical protein
MAEASSSPEAPASQIQHLLTKGLEWFGKSAAVLSILWTIVLLIVAKDDLNLVLWVQGDHVVYPGDATGKRPLPLEYRGASVAAARVVTVKISNFGKQMIGAQDKVWSVSLRAPEASHVVLLDELVRTPTALWVRVADGQAANAVVLEFGAFQPNASVDLRLMLVNDSSITPILRMTPSLPGLPREVVSRSPAELLADRLLPAVFFALALIGLVIDGPKMYQRSLKRRDGTLREGASFVGVFALRLFGVCVGAVFLAVIVAKGLGYIVFWVL